MSLIQEILYTEYEKFLKLPLELCEKIAKLAHINISFTNQSPPGEQLINILDLKGCTPETFYQLIKAANNTKTIQPYYQPQSKIAILIANNMYVHLSKLATPSVDCDSLANSLKSLGFIVITLKNTTARDLKNMLSKIFSLIPADSYCFIFYAGHGCQICNTKCMLCIDCPTENIKFEHCVTENYLLREVEKCKPELTVLIMDMCMVYLDRSTNPQIYNSMLTVEEYTIHRNLLIAYSTQSSKAAYEVLQIECSTTIDNDVTYELKTGDIDKIVPGSSQYVNALCTRLGDNLDVNSMLDKVHADVEKSIKKQCPIKLQCGVVKRSLYDPVISDTTSLLAKLKEASNELRQHCFVF